MNVGVSRKYTRAGAKDNEHGEVSLFGTKQERHMYRHAAFVIFWALTCVANTYWLIFLDCA